jgi:hypothetical protein
VYSDGADEALVEVEGEARVSISANQGTFKRGGQGEGKQDKMCYGERFGRFGSYLLHLLHLPVPGLQVIIQKCI